MKQELKNKIFKKLEILKPHLIERLEKEVIAEEEAEANTS